jgi:hypothetical protein
MRAYYETLSKEELIDIAIHYQGKFKITKLESEWLDSLADALRDGEDTPDRPTDEIKEMYKKYNEKILNKNWKL